MVRRTKTYEQPVSMLRNLTLTPVAAEGYASHARYAGTHRLRTESAPQMGPKTTKVYETLRERLASGQ